MKGTKNAGKGLGEEIGKGGRCGNLAGGTCGFQSYRKGGKWKEIKK